ncbi:hypothetical protein LJB90_02170 [Eubacteriales bacterium OttesenSCG-928-G02]|nr:hypothetical protein [Eubacteriales bacterium OttesenSCG-928-G02]
MDNFLTVVIAIFASIGIMTLLRDALNLLGGIKKQILIIKINKECYDDAADLILNSDKNTNDEVIKTLEEKFKIHIAEEVHKE